MDLNFKKIPNLEIGVSLNFVQFAGVEAQVEVKLEVELEVFEPPYYRKLSVSISVFPLE